MNKLDLRQVGAILGLPIYVDFDSIPDYKCDDGSLSERDKKQALVNIMLRESFGMSQDVDRLEIIDESGRAYVKGSIYGTPVSIDLSYQDDGRTLKVFVKDKK